MSASRHTLFANQRIVAVVAIVRISQAPAVVLKFKKLVTMSSFMPRTERVRDKHVLVSHVKLRHASIKQTGERGACVQPAVTVRLLTNITLARVFPLVPERLRGSAGIRATHTQQFREDSAVFLRRKRERICLVIQKRHGTSGCGCLLAQGGVIRRT